MNQHSENIVNAAYMWPITRNIPRESLYYIINTLHHDFREIWNDVLIYVPLPLPRIILYLIALILTKPQRDYYSRIFTHLGTTWCLLWLYSMQTVFIPLLSPQDRDRTSSPTQHIILLITNPRSSTARHTIKVSMISMKNSFTKNHKGDGTLSSGRSFWKTDIHQYTSTTRYRS